VVAVLNCAVAVGGRSAWLDACYGRRPSVRGEGGRWWWWLMRRRSRRTDVSRCLALRGCSGRCAYRSQAHKEPPAAATVQRLERGRGAQARQGKPICSSVVLQCLPINLEALV
jgi:hypothetical protein